MSQQRVALVTGASSGIGEASANKLLAAGYRVYGTSRRGPQPGQYAFPLLALDVTDDTSVKSAIEELIRLEGRIDLLVNNAGFGVAPAAAEESSVEQAKQIFDTNFLGIVRLTRAVLPHMRRQGSGRIINIGSILGSCRCRMWPSMRPASMQSKGIQAHLTMNCARWASGFLSSNRHT